MPASNKAKYMGQISVAANGIKIEIVDYKNSRDITVKFHDGNKDDTIVEHRNIKQFLNGSIKYPSLGKVITAKDKDIKKRLHEIRQSKDGHKMEITAYRHARSIDVTFDNGYIAKDKSYRNFKNGNIKCRDDSSKPQEKQIISDSKRRISLINAQRALRIHEKILLDDGQIMEIIKYQNAEDIDVQFNDEEKTIVKHKRYADFVKTNIRNPNKVRKHKYNKGDIRKGEENININGDHMKIIDYRTAEDMDVQFDDGEIIYNTRYIKFKNGLVYKKK